MVSIECIKTIKAIPRISGPFDVLGPEISSVEFHRATMASDGIYGKLRGLYSECPEDRWFIGWVSCQFPLPYALPRMSLAPEVSRLAALTLLPLVASLQLQSNNGEAIGASEAEFQQFIAQHQRTGMGIGWGEIKLMIF
jgi:hypothetical protein